MQALEQKGQWRGGLYWAVVGVYVGLLCAAEHSFIGRCQSLTWNFSSDDLDRMQSAEACWLVNTGG